MSGILWVLRTGALWADERYPSYQTCHRWLQQWVRSVPDLEGMEETLTVHRLQVLAQLRRTLASTNVIESAFSILEQVCRNVR